MHINAVNSILMLQKFLRFTGTFTLFPYQQNVLRNLYNEFSGQLNQTLVIGTFKTIKL